MKNTEFKGNWLVNYDAKDQKYPDILLILAKIQDYFAQKTIKFNSIMINFNKNGDINYFFKENNDVFLSFCSLSVEFRETFQKIGETAIFKPLEYPIKTISLLFPRLESDPRWNTMGVPAGHLFLASALNAAGYKANPLPLSLPGENRPSEASAADMTGITLFEDLLPLLRPFLADFRASFRGILAAGGPFPTLAPLSAIYHLPQVNLFVRGEAELALPKVLFALNNGDAKEFFANKGVFWHYPGVIAMVGFDEINRPEDFADWPVDLGFLRSVELEHGLEMNFSRGCRRGCVFCCHAQGRKLRKLPIEKAEELLRSYKNKVEGRGDPMDRPVLQSMFQGVPPGRPYSRSNPEHDSYAPAPPYLAVNINDDDILQEPDYAGEIFKLIKAQGFRIFGVQTSIASLAGSDGRPDDAVLDLVADPELYVENRPLLWLGTDAFLLDRARRLGKKLPPPGQFDELLKEMEARGLSHYHYWISSDNESTWVEFAAEFALICGFFRDHPGFGLLAHAPFVVPYPASALFGRMPANDPQLKIKLSLEAPDPRFGYKVVERMETGWPQLNALLRNEKAGGESGFFDLLKTKDLMAAAQVAYHFLKQEMLQTIVKDDKLIKARRDLEELLAQFVGSKNMRFVRLKDSPSPSGEGDRG